MNQGRRVVMVGRKVELARSPAALRRGLVKFPRVGPLEAAIGSDLGIGLRLSQVGLDK